MAERGRSMASIRQIADGLGVSKSYITKLVHELDPDGEHQTTGSRGMIEADAWLASAVAAEASRRKAALAAHDEALGVAAAAVSEAADAVASRYEAEVAALRAVSAEKDARIVDLKAQVASLGAQLADRDAEVARLRDYARRLEHAHWWQKRSVIESFGLLPEPRG